MTFVRMQDEVEEEVDVMDIGSFSGVVWGFNV